MKQPRICQWCQREIVKDRAKRMWATLNGHYYCPKDVYPERSQHIPIEPKWEPPVPPSAPIVEVPDITDLKPPAFKTQEEMEKEK